MTTTINSTALDFNAIKNNLKTYLAAKEEFADYNFEASGLSNILDVLAYNTHINALIANFALNESYLSTAQLRSSVVSLAEGIGYIPDTDTAARATVNLSFTTSAANRETTVALPAYTQFSAVVDDVTYTFQTIENYYATDDGTGFYQFLTAGGSTEIPIYEGIQRTKTFLVGEYIDNPTYILPDTTIDVDTAVVKVYPSASSSNFVVYQNILDASSIDANTRVYILKEAPNSFYELSFGDGETFGIAPEAGNKIVVEYISTAGDAANTATIFTPNSQFTSGTITADLQTTTVTGSIGGATKESIESIRKNAPFQYATQNRMVTAEDYKSLVLRKYSSLIDDIVAWGGQDNVDPEFGAVYMSILFKDSVTATTQASTKLEIVDLADQLAVISFRLRFSDPIITYIQVQNYFQFNPRLTASTLNTVQNNTRQIISNYFSDNTGSFGQAFRRSNMLSLIDESNPAILSSRADILMQQRFTPAAPALYNEIRSITNNSMPDSEINAAIALVNNGQYNDATTAVARYATLSYTAIRTILVSIAADNTLTLRFPAEIAQPDDVNYIISSNAFVYNGLTCTIQNRLNTNVLQIVSTSNRDVVETNIGSYESNTGRVTIQRFSPTSILGGDTEIILSVVPANPSAIAPTQNNILRYDPARSFARGIETTATN